MYLWNKLKFSNMVYLLSVQAMADIKLLSVSFASGIGMNSVYNCTAGYNFAPTQAGLQKAIIIH